MSFRSGSVLESSSNRLNRAFSRGLAQLRENGRYQAIIEQ
jgi:hypothetical protein